MTTRKCAAVLLSCVGSIFATACSSSNAPGTIAVTALGAKPLLLEHTFVASAYTVKDSEDSFWFSDVPFERLLAHEQGTPLTDAVFLHAQLIWTPKPGLTPLASTAMNLITRLVVVSGGEVGLYGGAAFARPSGKPGADAMELVVEGGTITLLAKTKGFHDLMSPAGLTGVFSAPFAPEDATRWRRSLSQFVTNAIGESMWVIKPEMSPDLRADLRPDSSLVDARSAR
ncbi:MAG: hypothetical protein DWI10_03720 [Planctomycetota bacterium]|nr:MAG: hypothetical protein DWI10_03720 [Planctomycetota bacterium]